MSLPVRVDKHGPVETDEVDRALYPRAPAQNGCSTPGCECRTIKNPNPNPYIVGGDESPSRHGLTVEDYFPPE